MKLKYLSILPVFAFLIGCATPYTCELGMDCMDLNDAYEAALGGGGNKETLIPNSVREQKQSRPLDEGRVLKKTKAGTYLNAPAVTQSWNKSQYGGSKLQDKPVYMPPKPLRIWIAPWVDEDEEGSRLLSGQFMYITIGGEWTMGQMGQSGRAGASMFEPWVPKPKDEGRVDPSQRLVR